MDSAALEPASGIVSLVVVILSEVAAATESKDLRFFTTHNYLLHDVTYRG